MGDDALHLDVAEGAGVEHAAGELQRLGKIAFVIQFVDRGTAHHAFDGQLRAERRNHNGIAGLQPFEIRTNSVQKQIVEVDFPDQLRAAVVAQNPQRSPSGGAAGLVERIERRGQRTDVISARAQHVPHHVNPHRTQAGQRNVGMHIAKLAAQCSLHQLLHIPETAAVHLDRARFRQSYAAFAVDHALQTLRNPAPQFDAESVSRTEHIVRSHRQIHGKFVEVARTVAEHVFAKTNQHRRLPGELGVEIVKGRHLGIRVYPAANGATIVCGRLQWPLCPGVEAGRSTPLIRNR